MDVLKTVHFKTKSWLFICALAPLLSSCQLPYLFKSAYHQTKLLNARVPIEKVLKDDQVPESTKSKLRLAHEAKVFAQDHLGLKPTKNYQSFVQLDQPHVTYILSAAPVDKLEHYLWKFPFVGAVPYKGYFHLEDAKKEQLKFPSDQFDTYVRGVSAYSTLGWFKDPLLSSMINAKDHDLVNLIIHETVHATIYIKGQADFNERLATFIGDRGTELYYLAKEGQKSKSLQLIQAESFDQRVFSTFISKELGSLKDWYLAEAGSFDVQKKQKRLNEILERYKKEIVPQLKTTRFLRFQDGPINNAILLSYQTYFSDLSDFEILYEKLGRDFKALMAYCKSLEKEREPEKALKKYIEKSSRP